MPADGLPAPRTIHTLSEREQNQIRLLSRLIPGDIVSARVTRTTELCVFADIGGSIDAILPAPYIAIVKEACKTCLFREGMSFHAAVHSVSREDRQIYLTHRELLGSFAQLAGGLMPGDYVCGRMLCSGRLLLSPNLDAVVTNKDAPWLRPGITVNAKVISVDPSSCQVRVSAENPCEDAELRFRYYFSKGRLKHWTFEPCQSQTQIYKTDFAV